MNKLQRENAINRMNDLSKIIHNKRSEFDWSTAKSIDDFESVARDECNEYDKLSRAIRKTEVPEMSAHNTFGNLYTMKEFIENCKAGNFIDYDGSGNYATKQKESNITILPSDIHHNEYRNDFTHVRWYNK